MVDTWYGYVELQRTANLNQENFDTLCNAFRALKPTDPLIPSQVMHTRRSLDDSAEIFEMKFNVEDVSVDSFKAFMADLFVVDVEDVSHEVLDDVSYSGDGRATSWWGFTYGAQVRLRVARFGQGADRESSRLECVAYLIANAADWEPEE